MGVADHWRSASGLSANIRSHPTFHNQHPLINTLTHLSSHPTSPSMKVIVVGGTGFVGREVIRQSLAHPSITSVISLGRRTTSAPDDAANAGKLTSVTCDDFTNYSESVKSALAGADACIWYAFPFRTSFPDGVRLLAVTPSKSMSMPKAEVRKICYDYTVTGLQTMAAQRKGAFRFIYTSGVAATADPAKKPWLMGDYSLMRVRLLPDTGRWTDGFRAKSRKRYSASRKRPR